MKSGTHTGRRLDTAQTHRHDKSLKNRVLQQDDTHRHEHIYTRTNHIMISNDQIILHKKKEK